MAVLTPVAMSMVYSAREESTAQSCPAVGVGVTDGVGVPAGVGVGLGVAGGVGVGVAPPAGVPAISNGKS
jgi:hypothetical protein